MDDIEYVPLLYIFHRLLELMVHQSPTVDRAVFLGLILVKTVVIVAIVVTVVTAEIAEIVEASDSYPWAQQMAVFEDF